MQRVIEAAGIPTILLSNIPELSAAVSAPRIAAIEYPCGRAFGLPGDVQGQTAVLHDTLRALVEIETPGGIRHLPYIWPESVPYEPEIDPPPIVEYIKRHPWDLPRLMSRNIPDKYRVYEE
ncbi:MAG: hypothetical protein ACWGO1_12535 [Anaerolineales bacterium]